MGALTKQQWVNARALYEDGESMMSIAKKYGTSAQTVAKHRDSEGWGKEPIVLPKDRVFVDDTELDNDETVTAADEAVVEAPAVDPRDVEIERLRLELDKARAEARQAQMDARGVVDIRLYTTPDEVVDVLGDGRLREIAYQRLARESRKRRQQGLPGYDVSQDSGDVQAEVDKIVAELLQERTKWVAPQHQVRVIKMVTPAGNIVQVPVESQINNGAGEQRAPIWKAKEKGYKITNPYLCQMNDCWLPAETDGSGRLTQNGYCSATHRGGDPYLNTRSVENVIRSPWAGEDWQPDTAAVETMHRRSLG